MAVPKPLRAELLAKQTTDVLIAARDQCNELLDARARQWNLFEPPAAAPAVTPAPVPEAAAIPEVLSPSSVNTFQQCSAKWYYRKVLQLPETRSGAAALGSALHAAVAGSMKEKMTSCKDWAVDRVRDAMRAALELQLAETELAPDESATELRECGDMACHVYMTQAAPSIQPAAVELPIEGWLGGVPVHGFVDILDVSGAVIDLKTAGKKPSSVTADHRLQITTYSMLAPGASGVGRRDVLTKTKTMAHYQQTFEVTPADREYAKKMYSLTRDQMRSGLIAPNRNAFVCSRKYCPFADQCERDFGGTVE